jgi:uncharacterized protein YcbK (DUF882 family)
MLGAGLVALTALAWWSLTAHRANALGEARTLTMYNIHTKETLTVTFKRDGQYDQGALKQLNTFMRDWRVNKETAMDPALIDLIWTLHKQLGSNKPIHLISGHRSATTNAAMRKKGGGQAKRSQHILGKAADISFPDVPVKLLRNSALVQEHGGVGYYPTSGVPFVHVDTGNVRMWPRIPRLELAALFPDGRTKYLPTDGKPITRTDYKLALAKGMVGKTMVASAAPLPTQTLEPESSIEAEVESAQPILASYTPDTPAEPEAHRQGEPPPPAKLFAYASAGGMSLRLPGFRHNEPQEATLPHYQDAAVVSAPEVDDDHPDELSYVPFEIAGLMTDASVTYSRTVAPMIHPQQGSIDYLFEDMDQPTAFTLRKSSGYSTLADAQRFSGHAVRNLYAEMETTPPSPTRLAQSTR